MRWVGDVFGGLGVTGRDREPWAAETEGITVNRISQGSGAVLLRASEPVIGRS